MSILSEFHAGAFTDARVIYGPEGLTIGDGDAVYTVAGELATSRDFETGGFDLSKRIEVVANLTEFTAAYPLATDSYHGKTATVRGGTYRVDSITTRPPVIVIELIETTKSA